MDELKEKLREAFAPISFELFNLVNLLSCSEHARDSVRHRVEGEIAQFWHEIQVAELAGPQPSLPRLGAQKHLETCCACNHGRTPCEEYRRNYENSSAVAGMEHPNGKISSVGDGLDIKQTASQPAPPSLSAEQWAIETATKLGYLSPIASDRSVMILKNALSAATKPINGTLGLDGDTQRDWASDGPALEEAAQLCEAQVEAILCGDVYDINDDPDTPKLTAAINAALKSQVSVTGQSNPKEEMK